MSNEVTTQSDGAFRVRTEEGADGWTVSVEGELSMLTAGTLRTVLLECLRAGSNTVLDAAGITAIDLSGLQLLCSAHRTYVAQKANLRFEAISHVLREKALAAGYDASRSVCPYRMAGNCLWKW